VANRRGQLTLSDIIDLVANETGDVQKVIEKAYDWEHTRKLETGKWLLASGTAALIGVVTLLAKETPPPSPIPQALAAAGSAAIVSGFAAIWLASTMSIQFARITSLAHRLQEIRPFLKLLRDNVK
jgi:hypothetical protein